MGDEQNIAKANTGNQEENGDDEVAEKKVLSGDQHVQLLYDNLKRGEDAPSVTSEDAAPSPCLAMASTASVYLR